MTMPAPEGGVVVATPPLSAGRRGRGPAYDWDAIAEWMRHPWNAGIMVRYGPVPAGSVGHLQEKYPDLAFLAHNHHEQVTKIKGDIKARTVCDVYVGSKGTGLIEDGTSEGE